MDIRTDIIVYIWLIPLFFFVIIPLSMFVVYSLWRFIYFMLFPRRIREQEIEKDIPERDMEKAL
jgi:ABC-type Fe3+ transport system permease subunit